MPKGTTKRIPDNSVLILLKFPSPMHLESFLDDEEFYQMAGKIQAIAMKHEGKFETNAQRLS
jgi:hypothetical protein